MLEAVGDGLSYAIDWHIHPFDFDVFNSGCEDFSRRADNFEPYPWGSWRSRFLGDGHPDGVRQLSCELVLAECADEADDPVGDKPRGFG
jgi:hypothetical protein